jgi:ribosome-associated translation inhibitor RaiA
MTTPLKITFHNMNVAPAIEADVRARMEWLETFYPGLTGGSVLVDVPHRHQRRGRAIRVNIALTVPGGEVNVHQEASGPTVAVHEAFDAARRQLEDFARRQRGD